MGAKKRFIPLRDDEFFNWQGNFVTLLLLYAVGWGIPLAAVTALSARRAEYEPLYHKAQNKTTRTKADVIAHRQMRDTYEGEIRAFVRKYGDFIPDTGKADLNLTIRDTEPSPGGPIDDVPSVKVAGVGGGTIKVWCKVTEDKTLPSMHPDANVVEYRYILLETGDVAPSDPEDCPKGDSSSRARFTIKAGAKNAGKRFYGFFRWVNNHRPRQEGDWTNAISVIVG